MTPRSAAASALSCRHGADPGRDERRERPPPAEPSPSSPARRKSLLPRTMRRSRRKSRRWFAAEEGTLPSSLDPRRCSFSSPDVAAEEASPPSSSSGRRRNRRALSSRAGDPSRSSPPRSLHPRGRDGRTRLPKAVLGGSSPLASFRSFRGGARRPNAPAAPKTFLTLRGTPSRDGDGSEGAWIAAVAASRRALRSFRRRFACAVEGKRRGEGEGSGVGGEGGRRGERVRARTGGGGGESRCRVRFRDARRNAPPGRDSGARRERRAGDAPPPPRRERAPWLVPRTFAGAASSPPPAGGARARARPSSSRPWDPPTSASVPRGLSRGNQMPAPTRARGPRSTAAPVSMRRASPPSSAARVAGDGALAPRPRRRALCACPRESSPSSSSRGSS